MKTKIVLGVLGLVSLVFTSLANAATVSLQPSTQTHAVGDPVSLTVEGSGFGTAGVTGGSIAVTWDANVLQLDTTLQDAGLDGFLNTSITDISQFTATPGQLLFTGTIGITALPIGLDANGNAVAFEFLHLHFTALAPPGTNAGIGLGTLGNWQLGDFNEVVPADVNYIGATVTIGAVPVPAAVWLFGSGLLGLVGVARRRQLAA